MIKVKEVSGIVLKPGDMVFNIHPGKYPAFAKGFEVDSIDIVENTLLLKSLNGKINGYYPNDNGLFPFDLEGEVGWFLLDLTIN